MKKTRPVKLQPKIKMIFSITEDGAIGNADTNDLIVTNSEDFEFFKQMTMNNIIVMGRNTWESLPKAPLPKRRNIVISSTMEANKQVEVLSELSDIRRIRHRKAYDGADIWIVGGKRMYEEGVLLADEVYVTHWNKSVASDTKTNYTRLSPQFFSELHKNFNAGAVVRNLADGSGVIKKYTRCRRNGN